MSRTWWLFPLGLMLLACSSPSEPKLEGAWGGADASMVLNHAGGTLSYACGSGTIDAGWRLTASREFSATGKHYFGGGPLPDSGRPPHQAAYSGRLSGDRLTLTITISDPTVTLGPFVLFRGGPEVFEVCD